MADEHYMRIAVSLARADLAELDQFAGRLRMTRSAAVRYAVRVAGGGDPHSDRPGGAGEELVLHNLVATEQVIKLLERFLPGGPAAAAEVLPLAVGAAQLRIADSGRLPG